jgi:phosphate uptake regulator
MTITERPLQQIGKSLLVTLPKAWTVAMQLEKGSLVKMLVTERGELLIAPEFTQQPESRIAVIAYDEHFPRRFFREYFAGNERITIQFSKENRAPVYAFIKRFMNVQVTEEKPTSITVTCFRIEELSITECLNRMHFLSLSMFSSDTATRTELDESLTRFYYLLVMQVRRFLAEGQYTAENQLSLLRAMDCRMVAEKIERIADILRVLSFKEADLAAIKAFYAETFSTFQNEDYERAVPLYTKGVAFKTTLKPELHALVQYVQEISLFVR